MSPVEVLREAAKLMRERARAANTDEERRPYADPRIDPVPETQWGKLVNNYLGGEMGAHCAAATPLVMHCVADLLEDQAEYIECVPYAVDADWIERNYRAPLAVARAYLGGDR